MKYISAKTILQRTKHGNEWFGIDFNMNLYKGCPHGCIYCDSRSNCYNIENFDEVRIKKNVIEILNAELKSKRINGVIGIGSMSDTYNPFEKDYEITKKALELIDYFGYGISLETKSDLIVRDIDTFKNINKKAPLILKMTITTYDDKLSKIIEPNVSVSSKRFEAIKKLSDEGLFVGVLLTPIIPFITDTEDNIKNIIKLAHDSGAKFIFSMGAVTLRENQREYFYQKLDKYFPKLKDMYIKTYGNNYICKSLNKNLGKIFQEECEKYNILYKMEDIIRAYKERSTTIEQLNFFK
ncbi:MAG: radical protein [Clostridia bacterium]|jgi:DNA repair photolyase|nr:radical protein [Clostridia bacterium]